MTIRYSVEPGLSRDDFIDVLQRSGLAERRPVDDEACIDGMLANADLVIAARDSAADNRLVGISRCVTDFTYCCYCSDLAVDRDYQGRGIGSDLIDASRAELGPKCSFFLISAPQAVAFYERIGIPRIERVFGWLGGSTKDGIAESDRS